MAYRNQPDPHQPPLHPMAASYPSQSQPSHDSHDYRGPFPQHYRDTNTPSRASSTVASDTLPPPVQQPLRSAIGHAFEKSDTARVIDPDLIAQITAEVKKSVLDEIKLSNIVAASQQQIPPSPASTSASLPHHDVYTPPSPVRFDSFSHSLSPTSVPFRDSFFDAHDDAPTPRGDRSAPIDIPCERFSARLTPVTATSNDDCTPIERMWQRLFSPDGQPLPRLGHFLRGLALHIVDDYEPKHSLVISPAKMLRFYDEVKVHDEIYPWQAIFGKLSYASLSKIYRDMRCDHHFIQEHPSEQPYIPALTPQGFEEWMTAMIQAYPDAEYERLARAVLLMPISNADDRKERFPKELPRRLFPSAENLHAQQRCAASLSAEGVGPLRNAPTFPPPPPAPSKSQPPRAASVFSNPDRERNAYVSKPEARSSCSENEDEESTPVPIERERKPYSAAPGGGKNHDDDNMNSSSSSNNNAYRPNYSDATPTDSRRRTQSQSITSQRAPAQQDTSTRMPPPVRTGSTASSNRQRPRSPPFSGCSEGTAREGPGSYGSASYGSGSHASASYGSGSYGSCQVDETDEERRRRYGRDADQRRYSWRRRSVAGVEDL